MLAWSRILALLGLVAVLLSLLVPGVSAPPGRLMAALESFTHVPLFALLMAGLLWLLPEKGTPRWLVVFSAVLLPVLVEGLQWLTGRSARVEDFLPGWLGGGMVVLGWSARGWAHRRWAGGLVALMGIWAAAPLALVVADMGRARSDFPLLASFESRLEMGRWVEQGCQMERTTEGATHGRYAAKLVVEGDDEYPGFFLVDAPRDWTGLKRLCFDVWNPGERPLFFWFRLDDRPGNPPYAQRCQERFEVVPGRQTLCLEAERFRAPSGRPLDLTCLHSAGFFFDGAKSGDVLYFDYFRGIE